MEVRGPEFGELDDRQILQTGGGQGPRNDAAEVFVPARERSEGERPRTGGEGQELRPLTRQIGLEPRVKQRDELTDEARRTQSALPAAAWKPEDIAVDRVSQDDPTAPCRTYS